MNIMQAVESGKLFRRKGRTHWARTPFLFDADEILATDWEIEERKTEITESEFDEAFAWARHRTTSLYVIPIGFVESIKKRLFPKC